MLPPSVSDSDEDRSKITIPKYLFTDLIQHERRVRGYGWFTIF